MTWLNNFSDKKTWNSEIEICGMCTLLRCHIQDEIQQFGTEIHPTTVLLKGTEGILWLLDHQVSNTVENMTTIEFHDVDFEDISSYFATLRNILPCLMVNSKKENMDESRPVISFVGAQFSEKSSFFPSSYSDISYSMVHMLEINCWWQKKCQKNSLVCYLKTAQTFQTGVWKGPFKNFYFLINMINIPYYYNNTETGIS